MKHLRPAEHAVPAGAIDHLRPRLELGLVRPEHLDGDRRLGRKARRRGQIDQRGRPVEPVQRHLVHRLAVVVEVERHVQVRALVRRHADLRDVVADRRHRVVDHHADLRVEGKIQLAVLQRMRQVDQRWHVGSFISVRIGCDRQLTTFRAAGRTMPAAGLRALDSHVHQPFLAVKRRMGIDQQRDGGPGAPGRARPRSRDRRPAAAHAPARRCPPRPAARGRSPPAWPPCRRSRPGPCSPGRPPAGIAAIAPASIMCRVSSVSGQCRLNT